MGGGALVRRTWERLVNYFFNRQPATKAATAATIHSMRHNWIACQSRVVRALKHTLTASAPTKHIAPRRNAAAAGVVIPSRSPRADSSARPGISRSASVFAAGRLRPQELQDMGIHTNLSAEP